MRAIMTGSSLAGQLLVATPHLSDPHFDRTVVLLLGHGPDGAYGVVLNRPTEVAVDAVLPGWEGLVTGPKTLFEGGPVTPEAAVCLGYARPGATPDGFTAIDGRIGVLDLSREPLAVAEGIEHVRVFAGYAGWGAGQLEAELGEDSWIVEPAAREDVFGPEPATLWSSVLRRKGGQFAILATMPPDPSVN
jgi:putative transcriptional regulator